MIAARMASKAAWMTSLESWAMGMLSKPTFLKCRNCQLYASSDGCRRLPKGLCSPTPGEPFKIHGLERALNFGSLGLRNCNRHLGRLTFGLWVNSDFSIPNDLARLVPGLRK